MHNGLSKRKSLLQPCIYKTKISIKTLFFDNKIL